MPLLRSYIKLHYGFLFFSRNPQEAAFVHQPHKHRDIQCVERYNLDVNRQMLLCFSIFSHWFIPLCIFNLTTFTIHSMKTVNILCDILSTHAVGVFDGGKHTRTPKRGDGTYATPAFNAALPVPVFKRGDTWTLFSNQSTSQELIFKELFLSVELNLVTFDQRRCSQSSEIWLAYQVVKCLMGMFESATIWAKV